MIVFELECTPGKHRFEGWFGSSQDYARQQERGLVSCPACGSTEVAKAPSAPRLARKGNQLPAPAPASSPGRLPAAPAQAMAAPRASSEIPPRVMAMMRAAAEMQAEALKASRWVGKSFADDARAMHYGEKDQEIIHGQATPEQARDLLEEGIAVAPLLFPVAPPDEIN